MTAITGQGERAWAFLSEGFVSPPRRHEPPSWEGGCALVFAHDAWRRQILEDLRVTDLDRELASLGGDPLREDWHDFRPLALAREEGWSDWLAHLLAGGDAEFLLDLFKIRHLPTDAPEVHRERVLLVDQADRSRGNYRSDLIIEWTEPRFGIHIEVKVGDPQFAKTWDEAQKLRATHGGEWHHFLLVLPEQKREAERTKEAKERTTAAYPSVTVLTWEHVEGQVRAALLRPSTLPAWRGIARIFSGALGQLLLRRPVLGSPEGETDGA